MVDIEPLLVNLETTIRDALACLDRCAKGIVLVTGAERHLIATLTDGDFRRAVLAGIDFAKPVADLLPRRTPTIHPNPFTFPANTSDADLLDVMRKYGLRHIPLLDETGRLVELRLWRELVLDSDLHLTAVVMAGGLGTRMRPLTESLPKPMLPVGERPLLEIILEQLSTSGIRHVNLTTHYKPETIAEHFEDGKKFGIDIQYIHEDQPLGTAGAIGLLDSWKDPVLVMNGDILTRVDFRAMLEFHQSHRAAMTVGVRIHETPIPFGVMELEGHRVSHVTEKPVMRHFINAGIYLLDPSVRSFLKAGQYCEMPNLINQLIAEDRRVVAFPIREYWIDIGEMDSYRRATADVERGNG